jgi:carboxyl-terminal processing protease
LKVDLGGGRFGFAAAKDFADGGSPGTTIALDEVYSHAPPMIEVASAALATRDPHIKVSGVATDGDHLLDTYVFVGSRKVFYQSNQNGPDPKKEAFDFDAALRPGVNVIRVFARESADTWSKKTLIVRRDGPNGELLATPTTEDALWDNRDSDEEP